MPIVQRSLIIVGCSARKRDTPGLLSAIERYDGGTFRVLRKARREGLWPATTDVLILSAEFGLIDASTPIPWYDRRMTQERSSELRRVVTHKLASYGASTQYVRAYIDLGQSYMSALTDIETIWPRLEVERARGRIGQRLAQLRSWLEAVITTERNQVGAADVTM